jgi:membrane-associated phospholipid phosphatase
LRTIALLFTICICTRVAAADSWHAGPKGQRRVVGLVVVGAGGLTLLALETIFRDNLASETCGWCIPGRLDHVTRKAVLWTDTNTATWLGHAALTVTAATSIGLLVSNAVQGSKHTQDMWANLIDDTTPILVTAVASQLVANAAQSVTARRRPYVHYNPPMATNAQDNASFFDDHTALAFAVSASAFSVVRTRNGSGKWIILSVGLCGSIATGYLRLAADRNYFRDVATGAVIGVGLGATVPALLRWTGLTVSPLGNGLAIAGRF